MEEDARIANESWRLVNEEIRERQSFRKYNRIFGQLQAYHPQVFKERGLTKSDAKVVDIFTRLIGDSDGYFEDKNDVTSAPTTTSSEARSCDRKLSREEVDTLTYWLLQRDAADSFGSLKEGRTSPDVFDKTMDQVLEFDLSKSSLSRTESLFILLIGHSNFSLYPSDHVRRYLRFSTVHLSSKLALFVVEPNEIKRDFTTILSETLLHDPEVRIAVIRVVLEMCHVAIEEYEKIDRFSPTARREKESIVKFLNAAVDFTKKAMLATYTEHGFLVGLDGDRTRALEHVLGVIEGFLYGEYPKALPVFPEKEAKRHAIQLTRSPIDEGDPS